MHSLFRNLFLVGLLATTVACGDDNDNDDDGNQAGNPVENPVATPGPSPTPGTTPAPFEWATARFEERGEGACNGYWRFTVRADGSFTSRNPCDAPNDKSGDLSATDVVRLDQAMDAISREEASSRLRCQTFDDGTVRRDQRLSMTIRNNRRFALYTQRDDRECVSGTAAEVTNLRNLLYEFRALYADPSIRM